MGAIFADLEQIHNPREDINVNGENSNTKSRIVTVKITALTNKTLSL
jgi:hypothetical protein